VSCQSSAVCEHSVDV